MASSGSVARNEDITYAMEEGPNRDGFTNSGWRADKRDEGQE